MPSSDEDKEGDMDKKIAVYKEQLKSLEQVSFATASDGICEIEEATQRAKRRIRRLEKA